MSKTHAIAPHALLVCTTADYTDQLRKMQYMYASGNHVTQLHIVHVLQDLVHTLHELNAMLACLQVAFKALLQYCSCAQPAS